MQIKIKATGIELTSAIETYVEEKLQSVEKFAIEHQEENPLMEVEIGKSTNHHRSGDVFRAEVNMQVLGKHFRVTSEKSDLYAAIDDLRDELVRGLRSYKGKERTMFRRGARIIKKMIRFGRSE
ncbi:MAG: ribosome-associated translation inhibitor RaiA [Candidatus Pacebacteria bacterium]|nr:ribosome-associated translation inhibitor RaiA [Candidatus Paceibacterota bacterium]